MLIIYLRFFAPYLRALNALLTDKPDCNRDMVETLLRQIDDIPSLLTQQAAYLAGGHANHQFLWKILGPQSVPDKPTGPASNLAGEIERECHSAEALKAAFSDAARALPIESWAFLSRNKPRTGNLEIIILPGNGSVLPITKPGILICDLWDHDGHHSHADWLEHSGTLRTGICAKTAIGSCATRRPFSEAESAKLYSSSNASNPSNFGWPTYKAPLLPALA